MAMTLDTFTRSVIAFREDHGCPDNYVLARKEDIGFLHNQFLEAESGCVIFKEDSYGNLIKETEPLRWGWGYFFGCEIILCNSVKEGSFIIGCLGCGESTKASTSPITETDQA